MAYPATAGYTVEDLDWLRAELGVAHLELDPWGSLIVSPATDSHEVAVAVLHEQLVRQLGLTQGSVLANGFPWKVPGGSGYTNVADLTVLAPGWHRVGDVHVEPPPLLVVEVASPSTRAVDRGRKLTDYRLGGALAYLLVDLLRAGQPDAAEFEVYDFMTDKVASATGAIEVVIDGRHVHLELPPAK